MVRLIGLLVETGVTLRQALIRGRGVSESVRGVAILGVG